MIYCVSYCGANLAGCPLRPSARGCASSLAAVACRGTRTCTCRLCRTSSRANGSSSWCACSTTSVVASTAHGDEEPRTLSHPGSARDPRCRACMLPFSEAGRPGVAGFTPHADATVLAVALQRGAAWSGRARWKASKKSKGVAGTDCADEPGGGTALTAAASSAAIGSGALAGAAAASSAAIGSTPFVRFSSSLSGWDRSWLRLLLRRRLGGLSLRLRLLLRRLLLWLRLRRRSLYLRRSPLSRLGLLLGLLRRRGMLAARCAGARTDAHHLALSAV